MTDFVCTNGFSRYVLYCLATSSSDPYTLLELDADATDDVQLLMVDRSESSSGES
jgi:hypothetical protein